MPSIFSSSIAAYASKSVLTNDDQSDLDLLHLWCAKVPGEVTVFTDDVHPSNPVRPTWNELLSEIEKGTHGILVVPSLTHIAGDDFIALSKVLKFLKANDVVLKSLIEVIDSRRNSFNDIILRLIRDLPKPPPSSDSK